jgi:hypothetical protein
MGYIKNEIIYNIALLFIIIFCTIINYDANMMSGLFVLYQDFSDYFKSGCNAKLVFKNGFYTFPMWGYGIILLLGKYKLLIIVFQQLLTYITLLYTLKEVRNILMPKFFNQFKLVILFSFPWFFFHTSLWPYSICANLLLIGMITLIKALKLNSFKNIVISSICFGIILNFRSDYYYYIFFLTAILLILSIIYRNKIKGLNFKNSLIWIFIINVFLIPWGVYTYEKTGSYLQTSTNAGHVFFIGLGQLPNNKWGITQEDNDPVMYSLIYNKYKSKNAKSLNFNENKFLIEQFILLVKNDPFEYLKKCTYVFYRIIRTPFYTGSLEKYFASENKINDIKIKIKFMLDNFNFVDLFKYVLLGEGLIYLSSGLINIFSIIIFTSFLYYALKLIICINYRKIDIIVITVTSLILFQLALSLFAFYMPIYNTNLYIFYIFSIFYIKNKLSNISINNTTL